MNQKECFGKIAYIKTGSRAFSAEKSGVLRPKLIEKGPIKLKLILLHANVK